MDLAIILLFVCAALLVYAHVTFFNPLLDKLRRFDKPVYVEAYTIAIYEKYEHRAIGVIVLASWIKV